MHWDTKALICCYPIQRLNLVFSTIKSKRRFKPAQIQLGIFPVTLFTLFKSWPTCSSTAMVVRDTETGACRGLPIHSNNTEAIEFWQGPNSLKQVLPGLVFGAIGMDLSFSEEVSSMPMTPGPAG